MGMLKISKANLQRILRKKFSSLVGKSCKRLEVLKANAEISEKAKLGVVRDLIKELDYETMRDIEEAILSFGQCKIDVQMRKPNSDKKE